MRERECLGWRHPLINGLPRDTGAARGRRREVPACELLLSPLGCAVARPAAMAFHSECGGPVVKRGRAQVTVAQPPDLLSSRLI
jgi:hypothetical protein